MDFKTDGFMYAVAILIVLFVIADSLFFLIRAWKRGVKIGMDKTKMKSIVVQSSLFSMPAAISIVMTIVALSGAMGIVLPWIRLSVIGSVSYEVPAALAAMDGMGIKTGLAAEITDPKVFVSIAWVMTFGVTIGLGLVPFCTRYIQNTVSTVAAGNNFVSNVLTGAAFIGLMVAFVARSITGAGDPATVADGAGIMSISALIISCGTMFVLSKVNNKVQNRWLDALAMPLSMLAAMIGVVILGQILPESLATLEWRY